MGDEITEDLTETDYSDGFIVSDDELDDGLTWESEDSRPACPSPPSMTESPAVGIRGRLRARGRRRVYVEPDTQSDVGSEGTSETQSSFPPSPTVSFIIHEDTDTLPDAIDNHSDSDETNVSHYTPSNSPSSDVMPLTPETITYEPQSPDYSPPESPLSPDYPPPEDESEVEVSEPPEEDNPNSPDYPPPGEESEVEAAEPPEVEIIAEVAPNNVETTLARNRTVTDPQSDKPSATTGQELNSSTLSDGDEGNLCAICMDPLTNSGKHRVVCLRCGHIFGQSCLERWIKVGCNQGAQRCPTCNKRACLKDIRILFIPKVVPLDTVERDRLLEEKEQIAAQKNALENELRRCKLQNELTVEKYEIQIKGLQEELDKATKMIEYLNQGKKLIETDYELPKSKQACELQHIVEITKEGGCRVLAFSNLRKELVVSQPSGNTVFAGYGVRILNTVDFQPSRFIFLHNKAIRDLAFHTDERDLLLSVSIDQTAKLVDLCSNSTVCSFLGKSGSFREGPLWACCWDAFHPHLMYIGSQLGKVFQFDRRMPDNYVNLWEDKTNPTPVAALASVPSIASSPFPQGGFISCRLNGVYAYARQGEQYISYNLPLEGPFISMRFDHTMQSLLTMSRPNSRYPFVRINFNNIDITRNGDIIAPQIHTFNCGSSASFLSRTVTAVPTLKETLVAGYHESGKSLNMWSSKSGSLVHSVPVKDPIMDLSSFSLQSDQCLVTALSEKRLSIFKVK